MAIEVRCGCGQLVYPESRYAGQHVQCPHCLGVVAVPVATASTAPHAPATGEPRRPSFWATQTGQMCQWGLVVFVLVPMVGAILRGCQAKEDAKRPTFRERLDKAAAKLP